MQFFEKGLIVAETLTEVTKGELNITDNQRAIKLFTCLLKKIRYKSEVLEVFLKILDEDRRFHSNLIEVLDKKILEVLDSTATDKGEIISIACW